MLGAIALGSLVFAAVSDRRPSLGELTGDDALLVRLRSLSARGRNVFMHDMADWVRKAPNLAELERRLNRWFDGKHILDEVFRKPEGFKLYRPGFVTKATQVETNLTLSSRGWVSESAA